MTEREIFTAALHKHDVLDRAAFLDGACAVDAGLRQRVDSLLATHEQLGSFFEIPEHERPPIWQEQGSTDRTSETEAPHPPETEMPLDFMQPSEQPGHLGRLGHYEVLEIIGRGGMGIVLRAFDERLHRVVAIKIMAPQLATNAMARKRFMREAQAAAAVSHDHVVTIHAVDEANGRPYIAMQYVAGLSLEQRIERSGPLALHEILRIGMQTTSGLAAAHVQGLIHRDIKPANILLENGVERVKITDFGLARAADDASLTQSGTVAGTPHYMAPEQARGEPLDARTDLFSMGSVLYAMCTGRSPFRASGSMAVLKRVCEETPTPIRETNPEVPDWLVAIIDKLHAKDPAERFQSAAEVADLLGRHLAHVQHPSVIGPVSSLPVSRKPGSKSAPRRHRWAMAAAVLVLCLLGGVSLTEATGVTQFRATAIRIFTPDGTLVVEVDDPGVKVTIEGDGGLVITGAGPQEVRLHPGSYKVLATKDGKPVKREVVAITRGGKQVVRVSMEGSLATRQALAPRAVLEGHGSWVQSLAFSPDGKTLVTGSNDQRVRTWDTKTGDQTGQFHADEALIHSLAYSPDGAVLVTGSNVVRVWDAVTFERLAEAKHGSYVTDVAFRRGDAMLATASSDMTVKLWKWDGKILAPIRTLEHSSGVSAVSFDPQGAVIACVTWDGMLCLWDVESGERLKSAQLGWQMLSCLAFSPDGRTIAAGGYDKRVELRKADTLESVGTLRGHQEHVWALEFLRDGKTLVSAGGHFDHDTQTSDRPGELKLWDTGRLRERLSIAGYEKGVRSLAISIDGETLATGDFASQGRLWDVDVLTAAADVRETASAEGSKRAPIIDYVRQANEHTARGQLDQAAKEFSIALSRIAESSPYGAERLRIVDEFVPSDELFERVVKLRPKDIDLWSHRAHHLAKMGRWEESIACFLKRLELGPDGSGLWAAYSLALLAKDDLAAYRSLCEKMLAEFGDATVSTEAAHAALAMAIVPDSVKDKQRALRLAERAANNNPDEVWWISLSYAAWLYRLDRLEEAIGWLDKGKDSVYPELNLSFLAMAHHRLGHADEARRYADAARQKKSEWTEAMVWAWPVQVERLIVEMDSVLAAEPDKSHAPQPEDAKPPTTRDDEATGAPASTNRSTGTLGQND